MSTRFLPSLNRITMTSSSVPGLVALGPTLESAWMILRCSAYAPGTSFSSREVFFWRALGADSGEEEEPPTPPTPPGVRDRFFGRVFELRPKFVMG